MEQPKITLRGNRPSSNLVGNGVAVSRDGLDDVDRTARRSIDLSSQVTDMPPYYLWALRINRPSPGFLKKRLAGDYSSCVFYEVTE